MKTIQEIHQEVLEMIALSQKMEIQMKLIQMKTTDLQILMLSQKERLVETSMRLEIQTMIQELQEMTKNLKMKTQN